MVPPAVPAVVGGHGGRADRARIVHEGPVALDRHRARGTFTVPESAITDPEEATTTIHGALSTSGAPSTTVAETTRAPDAPPTTTAPEPLGEVVVDVQTHFLESGEFGLGFPQASCGAADPSDCFSAEYWRELVLVQSDTRVVVIWAVPVVGDADPLSVDAMERGGRSLPSLRRRARTDPGPRGA